MQYVLPFIYFAEYLEGNLVSDQTFMNRPKLRLRPIFSTSALVRLKHKFAEVLAEVYIGFSKSKREFKCHKF